MLSAFLHSYLAIREDADVVAVDGGGNEVAGVLEDVYLVVTLLLRSRPHLMPANDFTPKRVGCTRAYGMLAFCREGEEVSADRIHGTHR